MLFLVAFMLLHCCSSSIHVLVVVAFWFLLRCCYLPYVDLPYVAVDDVFLVVVIFVVVTILVVLLFLVALWLFRKSIQNKKMKKKGKTREVRGKMGGSPTQTEKTCLNVVFATKKDSLMSTVYCPSIE